MANFVTPAWDSDTVGDKAHTEIFHNSVLKKKFKKSKKQKPHAQITVTANAVKKKKKNKNSFKKPDKSVESKSPPNKKHQENLNLPNQVKGISKYKKKKIKNEEASNKNAQKQNEQPSKKSKWKNRKNDKTETDRINPKSVNIKKKKSRITEPKAIKLKMPSFKTHTPLSLRDRMMQKLRSARFRYLNEQLYTNESKNVTKIFEDSSAYETYHEGYRQQVASWPLNPLDKIINNIRKMPPTLTIADFGCGEARLARSVPQKVHSFDLVALNSSVTACNMASSPLGNESIDVAVYCLSLMNTNLQDIILEANRVLKIGGIMKIAEVESRFDTVETFIDGVQHYGFKNTLKDLSHNMFYFLYFKKVSNVKKKSKMPTIGLRPCLYKKR